MLAIFFVAPGGQKTEKGGGKLKRLTKIIKSLFLYGDGATAGKGDVKLAKKELLDKRTVVERIKELIEDGEIDAAMDLYRHGSDVPDDNPYIGLLRGKQQVDAGDLGKASATYQQLKETSPKLPMLNFALGNVALAREQYELALGHYADELNADPGNGLVWVNFGVAHFKAGNLSRATKALLKACDLLSDDTIGRVKLSRVYFAEQQLDLAENTLLGIDRFEENLEAMELLVSICIARKEYERAIDYVYRLQSSLGESSRVQGYLGFVFQAKGDFHRALEHYDNAVKLDPSDFTAMYNLGTLYRDLGRYNKARECFQAILDQEAEHSGARWGLSLCMLLNGEYAGGWLNYEQRIYCEDYSIRNFQLPRWDGEKKEDLNLLVTAEQGLGDEIMFASCIPDLMKYEGNLLLECNPKLAGIFTRSFADAVVVGRTQTINNNWVKDYPKIKTTIPAGSLPLLFRKEHKSFPHHDGYLKADDGRVNYWKKKLAALNDLPKIGLSWRGGVESSKSVVRSIPLELWRPVLDSPCQFVSLQYTDCQEEIDHVNQVNGNMICHWQEAIDDYDETAALIMALDLVISVQTAVVHLAGSLGAPVIALISAAPEWRYRAEGDTMPWYPSVRLIRQTRLGDWQEALLEARDIITTEPWRL
jgi:tetratricopeptide (TPR) repeat protein